MDGGTAVSVNLGEMARLIGCSLPTMRSIVQRHPDLPRLQEGSKSREWLFEPQSVLGFLDKRKEEQERGRAQHDQQLAQLVLPIGPTQRDGAALSIQDEMHAAKLRRLLNEEAKACAFLVRRDHLASAAERLLGALRTINRDLVDDLKEAHNLPDAVVTALRMKFENAADAAERDFAAVLNPNASTGSLFG